MFTTDELEAAGQRAATHPVEVVPDVAEIQREVVRRRQSKRLLVGASTATCVLFGIGGLLLFSARDSQVQVITASPVLESETQDSGLAGQEARTGSDGGSDTGNDDDADDGTDGASGTAGEDGEDGTAGGSSAASSSSTSEDDLEDGEVTSGYTTTVETEDNGKDPDGGDRESDDDGEYDRPGFVLPEDMEEWLEDLKDRGPIDGEWRDYDLWPLGLEGFDLEISVGEEAIADAVAARSAADDSFITDGRTIWIDRQTDGNERRNRATVSTLVDDEWFVSASGPADQEATLLRLISQYDDDWEEQLIPEDLDRVRDWDWLTWPPTEEDFEDWQDAREDWLKQHEELLKENQERVEETRKQAEEERKRVEEERKRIEEERNNDDDDDDD